MLFGIDPQALFRHTVPTRVADSRRKARRGESRIGHGFETLEPRQMMAADMAEIVGVIRLDAQYDGNAANDILVQGATVKLYRDSGNGQFSGDDVLAATVTSNSV